MNEIEKRVLDKLAKEISIHKDWASWCRDRIRVGAMIQDNIVERAVCLAVAETEERCKFKLEEEFERGKEFTREDSEHYCRKCGDYICYGICYPCHDKKKKQAVAEVLAETDLKKEEIEKVITDCGLSHKEKIDSIIQIIGSDLRGLGREASK